MKTRVILYFSVGAVLLSLCSMKAADITYDVNLAVGVGGVTGTIETDGHTGVIGAADILAWNLNVTGNGASLNLVNGPSGVLVGNIFDPLNPSAGTPDLTATASHIFFNFSGTDGGYAGFQTAFYSGQQYWSLGALNNNFDVYQGLTVAPIGVGDPSTINVPESGNQIIASVARISSVPDLTGTMPLLGLGLGALAACGRRFRK